MVVAGGEGAKGQKGKEEGPKAFSRTAVPTASSLAIALHWPIERRVILK